MWTDEMDSAPMPRESWSAEVDPDATRAVRVYVVMPEGRGLPNFAFKLRALDKDGGEDTHKVHFDAPEDE